MKLLIQLLILPLYLISNQGKAQSIAEKDITGSWTVSEVISTKPNNDTQKKVVGGYKNAVFVFNADHSFVLKTTDKSIYITMLTQQLAKAQWQFNAGKNEIAIGTPQNNFSILKIQMQQKDGGALFILEDSGIGLVMKR